MSNNTTFVAFQQPLYVRLFAGISFAALSGVSLIVYGALLLTIKRFWKELRGPWYYLVVSLSVADSVVLFFVLILLAPSSMTGFRVFGDPLSDVMSHICSFFWHGIFYTTCGMTVSRYLCFLHPKIFSKLFEKPGIYGSLLLFWVISLTHSVAYAAGSCTNRFYPEYLATLILCPDSGFGAFVGAFSWWEQLLFPFVAFGLYILIFVHLRMKNHNSVVPQSQQQSTNIEKRMLVQAFIVCFVLFLEIVAFWTFPTLIGGWFGSVLTNWAIILNSSINPIVYLIFNPVLREKAKKTCVCGSTKVSSISATNSRDLRRKSENTDPKKIKTSQILSNGPI